MSQSYHANAKTNVTIRQHIQKSEFDSTNQELATRYHISVKTVHKWKRRSTSSDNSSTPKSIEYGLTDLEMALAISIRSSSWLPLDEVWEMLLNGNDAIKRSSVYSCFVRNKINTIPVEKKETAQKFKAYQPGYLHIDVTYLPKLGNQKYYLFVAIDRATRLLFYHIYEDKTAQSTDDFFDRCLAFFPFEITHILTDNGLEFTNKLIRSKKGDLCGKDSLLDLKCKANNIDHRLTKPSTPKTNGMVERVNGTIKNNTILQKTYLNKDEMNSDLMRFMLFYNRYRRHGSLKKELNVKTPIEAIERWYILEPKIFKETPSLFKQKLLYLNQEIVQITEQPYQT